MSHADNLMSLAAYANWRGVSAVAVLKAVATGWLAESVVKDARGAPKIATPSSRIARGMRTHAHTRTSRRPRRPGPADALDVPDYMESPARRPQRHAEQAASPRRRDGDGERCPRVRSWWCCPWWRARRLRAGPPAPGNGA
jgi:hypothetical protein